MERGLRFRRTTRLAILSAPLVVFASLMLWLSRNPITPSAGVEASASNPAGLLTSNFVYDGSINIENIALSCVFLLFLCLFLPRRLDVYLVYVLPVGAVASGALGELTAISAPYVSTTVCGGGCSFYGMSGIGSAMVGFTFAVFFIAFGLTVLAASGRLPGLPKPSRRREVLLVCAFAAYVILLLFFAGLIALPSHPQPSQGGGSSPPSPPPPAILTQTPPVALVHGASLVYGFLLCVITFALVNRRYRLAGLQQRVSRV